MRVNAVGNLAVLAWLLDGGTEISVSQRDAMAIAARAIYNLTGWTEPWASIQLRRRRPYAVDEVAISSQSPCSFVGENFVIAIPRLRNHPLRSDYHTSKL
jgi:hypothetical protein